MSVSSSKSGYRQNVSFVVWGFRVGVVQIHESRDATLPDFGCVDVHFILCSYTFMIREMQPSRTSGVSMFTLQYVFEHSCFARCNPPGLRGCRCSLYNMFVHIHDSPEATLPHFVRVDVHFIICLYTFMNREMQPSRTSGVSMFTL